MGCKVFSTESNLVARPTGNISSEHSFCFCTTISQIYVNHKTSNIVFCYLRSDLRVSCEFQEVSKIQNQKCILQKPSPLTSISSEFPLRNEKLYQQFGNSFILNNITKDLSKRRIEHHFYKISHSVHYPAGKNESVIFRNWRKKGILSTRKSATFRFRISRFEWRNSWFSAELFSSVSRGPPCFVSRPCVWTSSDFFSWKDKKIKPTQLDSRHHQTSTEVECNALLKVQDDFHGISLF